MQSLKQTTMDIEHGGLDHDSMRLHEADFTPEPVVAQLFRWLRDTAGASPFKILDPCAGAGVFSMVARDMFESCRTLAVEVRDEECENLASNAHEYAIADVVASLRRRDPYIREWVPFDLCVGNPAFSLIPELVPLLLDVTSPGGFVVVLGLNELGQRGSASRDVWQRHPPYAQLRIAGTLKFRTGINPAAGKPYTTDSRSYSWWIWAKTPPPRSQLELPSWLTIDLPLLFAHERQWRIRPGTEWQHR